VSTFLSIQQIEYFSTHMHLHLKIKKILAYLSTLLYNHIKHILLINYFMSTLQEGIAMKNTLAKKHSVIGERLTALRKATHHTQFEMAEIVGKSLTQWRYYEYGINRPKDDVFQKLSEKFKIDIQFLKGYGLSNYKSAIRVSELLGGTVYDYLTLDDDTKEHLKKIEKEYHVLYDELPYEKDEYGACLYVTSKEIEEKSNKCDQLWEEMDKLIMENNTLKPEPYSEILTPYKLLNKSGQKKAVRCIEELLSHSYYRNKRK